MALDFLQGTNVFHSDQLPNRAAVARTNKPFKRITSQKLITSLGIFFSQNLPSSLTKKP